MSKHGIRWKNLRVTNTWLVVSTYIAAVVDEARQVAALGRVDDCIQVYPEQVGAADAGRLVVRLPYIRHDRPDHLPDVLYHHLVGCYRLLVNKASYW